MKIMKFWQSLLIALMLMPAIIMAQPFNNLYSFQTPYTNSVHTNGVQIQNGFIAEGGTIEDPVAPPVHVVEIGIIDPFTWPYGQMNSPTYYYFDILGQDLNAVDLVESQMNPNQVVEVANYWDNVAGQWRIVVFETDPSNGMVNWSLLFGNGLPDDLLGAAIATDMNGDHYVLGHSVTAAGFMTSYIAKITGAGAVAWENFYNDVSLPGVASHESVDILFDPNPNSVVFTANRTLFPLQRDGFVTLEVNPGNGAVMTSSHVPILNGTADLVARDMDFTSNAEYAIVGRVNVSPVQAFMVMYLPGLAPAGPPFSTIYFPTSSGDLYFTGIKPFFPMGNMVVSFEWNNGPLYPGMIEVAANEAPMGPAVIWSNNPPPGTYIASRGLIALNGNMDMALKGSVNYGTPSAPSLNVWAHTPPFNVPTADNCEDIFEMDYFNDAMPAGITFRESSVMTDIPKNISSNTVTGEVYNCALGHIGSFKLAAPNGIAENAEALGMNIYPNPTDGNFTIELNEEMTEIYQSGEIFNALGEVVMTFNVNNTIERIDLTKQVPGIYLVRLKASNGNVSDAKRIMVK